MQVNDYGWPQDLHSGRGAPNGEFALLDQLSLTKNQPTGYGEFAESLDEVYRYHGIDTDSIVSAGLDLVNWEEAMTATRHRGYWAVKLEMNDRSNIAASLVHVACWASRFEIIGPPQYEFSCRGVERIVEGPMRRRQGDGAGLVSKRKR
jgi:hypothetical protein